MIKALFPTKIYSYTHYPTVQEDMLKTVAEGRKQFNNAATSGVRQQVKLVYYRGLIQFYKICGRFADQIAANSTWTRDHCKSLWNPGAALRTIYPPCGIDEFKKIAFDGGLVSAPRRRCNIVLSFAQFRPEKDHLKQLEIWKAVLEDPEIPDDATLVMVGSCRDETDEKLVSNILKKAKDLGIQERIRIEKN